MKRRFIRTTVRRLVVDLVELESAGNVQIIPDAVYIANGYTNTVTW